MLKKTLISSAAVAALALGGAAFAQSPSTGSSGGSSAQTQTPPRSPNANENSRGTAARSRESHRCAAWRAGQRPRPGAHRNKRYEHDDDDPVQAGRQRFVHHDEPVGHRKAGRPDDHRPGAEGADQQRAAHAASHADPEGQHPHGHPRPDQRVHRGGNRAAVDGHVRAAAGPDRDDRSAVPRLSRGARGRPRS